MNHLPPDWIKLPEVKEIKSRVVDFFRAELNVDLPIIKDPRLCRLLPVWFEIFEELNISPQFVFILRDPNEVAASSRKMKNFKVMKTLVLYMHYLISAETLSRNYPRAIVTYAELCNDWKAVISRIKKEADIVFPDRDVAESTVGSFISKDLNHYSPSDSQDEFISESLSNFSSQLYELLAIFSAQNIAQIDTFYQSYWNHFNIIKDWFVYDKQVLDLEQELVWPAERAKQAHHQGAKSILYWTSETVDDWRDNKIVCNSNFDDEEQVLKFIFPEEIASVKSLRYRVIDRPALVTMKSFLLLDNKGYSVWKWDGKSQIITEMSAYGFALPNFSNDDHLCFYTMQRGFNANIELPIEALSQIKEGWSLVISISYQEANESLPLVFSYLSKNKLNKQITEMKQQKQRDYENSIRLEAQLELLKELLLNEIDDVL